MLKFVKLEGCGNDFVVVDLRAAADQSPAAPEAPSPDNPSSAEVICDRRFGVGADGVLAILPAESEGAVARMRVMNADGSEAEMCGNGIRCVAKYLYERDPAAHRAAQHDQLAIDTGAGLLRCGITVDKHDRVSHVSVQMGKPRLSAAEIPVHIPGIAPHQQVVNHEIDVSGRRFKMTCVSMGNPHAVIFVAGDEKLPLRALAETYGPALERHPFFPRKTNVEFARLVAPGEIELVVWERGCGITLACGTGACATAVAAVMNHHAFMEDDLAVALPGGTLQITVADGLAGVLMRGPAAQVFEGELDVASLLSRGGHGRIKSGAVS